MRRFFSCSSALLTCLIVVPLSAAAAPTVSPEALAASSDLVIVGRVKEIDAQPKAIALKLADQDLGNANVPSAQVVIEKVIARGVAAGVAPATQPQADANRPPAAAIIEVVSLQSRARLRFAPPAVQLQKDGKYILYLRKIVGSAAYFMQAPQDLEEATDDAVAAAEKAAKPENWPWGAPVRDLRLALLIPAEVQGLAGGAAPPDGIARVNVSPVCVVAIQNVGKSPIALNTRPDDKCLSATIAQGEAKAQGDAKAQALELPAAGQPNPQTVALIPPGGIALVTPGGTSGGFALPLRAQFGKATIELSYKSDRIGFADEMKKDVLWKGALSAKPTEVNITQNNRVPQPPIAPPGRLPPVRLPPETLPPQPAE